MSSLVLLVFFLLPLLLPSPPPSLRFILHPSSSFEDLDSKYIRPFFTSSTGNSNADISSSSNSYRVARTHLASSRRQDTVDDGDDSGIDMLAIKEGGVGDAGSDDSEEEGGSRRGLISGRSTSSAGQENEGGRNVSSGVRQAGSGASPFKFAQVEAAKPPVSPSHGHLGREREQEPLQVQVQKPQPQQQQQQPKAFSPILMRGTSRSNDEQAVAVTASLNRVLPARADTPSPRKLARDPASPTAMGTPLGKSRSVEERRDGPDPAGKQA